MRKAAVVGVALLIIGASATTALAVFLATEPVGSNSFTTAADWQAPTVSTSVVAKTSGYTAGQIKQGASYFVYANIADEGNPPSGVSTATANMSAIDSGVSAAALTAGSYTIEGTSYNYRSASLTANATITAGSYTYSITATDAGGRSTTQTGLTLTVDNTAPAGSDIQTANKAGGTNGLAELGDVITFTFTEALDPNAILSGWTGASTNVVVRLNTALTSDNVQIYNAGNTAQLPLGQVTLNRTDYTSSNRTFGATGTPSTMVLSGSTITITLGTASGAVTTAAGTGNMTWPPSSTAQDRAGNGCSTTSKTETGTADKDF